MTKYNPEIYERMECFLNDLIEYNLDKKVEIYNNEKVNLEIKTSSNLFYDSLYGNFKVKDLIDMYAK